MTALKKVLNLNVDDIKFSDDDPMTGETPYTVDVSFESRKLEKAVMSAIEDFKKDDSMTLIAVLHLQKEVVTEIYADQYRYNDQRKKKLFKQYQIPITYKAGLDIADQLLSSATSEFALWLDDERKLWNHIASAGNINKLNGWSKEDIRGLLEMEDVPVTQENVDKVDCAIDKAFIEAVTTDINERLEALIERLF